MIKHFKSQLRFTFSNSQPNVPLTVLPNFKTEQFSNDYISSLCRQKLFKEALKAFDFLQTNTSFQIKLSTYAHLISACSSLKSIEHGKKIHSYIQDSNCQPDIILQNHILNMYGKCGSLMDARKLFDDMPHRNVVSWTSVIAGYSQNGQEVDAINLYLQMLLSGVIPDQFTFGSIIKACSGLMDVWLGRQLHVHVIKSEFGSHHIAQNALIAMYTKFNQIVDASNVFARIGTKDLISWGSMISACSQLGHALEALFHFKELLCQDMYQPNEFIFSSAFSACSSLLQPEYGRQIHGMCLKFGLGIDIFAGCSLCDMYAKCGFLDSAEAVFYHIERPDLVAWNAIIAGFSYGGDAIRAISFFSRMRHLGFIPDESTVISLLCSCISPLALSHGLQVHSYIIKSGFSIDVQVCNTLLTMYAKCSDLCDAFYMFKEMDNSADLVSWNTILTACTQHNHIGEVFRLLKLMLVSQNKPDHITLANILGACTRTASLGMGNQIHCYSTKAGFILDILVINGLIDMYTKCGSLTSALEIFDSMENPDVVSWSSLIVGYAQIGNGEEALKLFRTMRSLGFRPNQVTYVGVLTACSHVGLVEEGLQLFRTMETEHGIVPTREHCSCMVDLLARAGCLNEAESFINQSVFDPDIVIWKTLLAACKTHGNAEIGKRAAENILNIDPSNSAAHVLLCHIYASTGNWEHVSRLRSLMKQRGVRKVPGQSWIEVKDTSHVFVAEDTLHPERDKIYTILEELWLQILDAGYDPFEQEVPIEPLLT